ncbi:MAG: LOG family protein, partial [Myxococcota bacterium]
LTTRSDGALIVPGGLGTLMEVTTMMAFRASGEYPHPVVVYNADDWAKTLLDTVAQLQTDGAVAARGFFECASTASEAVALVTLSRPKQYTVAKFRKRLPPQEPLHDELFALARDSAAAFRGLPTPLRCQRFDRAARDPALPSFVVVVHTPPSQAVFDAAFQDEDQRVVLAAADRASHDHVRTFLQQHQTTFIEGASGKGGAKRELAKRWLGSLDPQTQALVAQTLGRGHTLNVALRRLEADVDPNTPSSLRLTRLLPGDPALALAWNEPLPLLRLAQQRWAIPSDRIQACHALVERLGPGQTTVPLGEGRTVVEVLKDIARELDDAKLVARLSQWEKAPVAGGVAMQVDGIRG